VLELFISPGLCNLDCKSQRSISLQKTMRIWVRRCSKLRKTETQQTNCGCGPRPPAVDALARTTHQTGLLWLASRRVDPSKCTKMNQ
jgi:hypothetical protein